MASLTNAEISFLNYCDGKKYNLSTFSKSFYYEYDLDYKKAVEKLLSLGYLTFASPSKSLESYTNEQLKRFLKQRSLPVSGTKNVLIKRITDNFSEEELGIYFNEKVFKLTDSAITLIDEYFKKQFDESKELIIELIDVVRKSFYGKAYNLIGNGKSDPNNPNALPYDYDSVKKDIDAINEYLKLTNRNSNDDFASCIYTTMFHSYTKSDILLKMGFFVTDEMLQKDSTAIITIKTLREFSETNIPKYRISSCGDSRVCPTCRAMDGKVFEVAKANIGVNAPPFCDECRCTILPIFTEREFNTPYNKVNWKEVDERMKQHSKPKKTQEDKKMFISTVIAGDYKGREVKTTWGGVAYINAKGGERILIDSSTVKSYEVLEIDDKKSFSSGVARGLVGGAVLGSVGVLAGVNSAKSLQNAKIKIQFKNGKCSLLYVDKPVYEFIINKCFNLDTEEDTPATYQPQQTSYIPTHSSNKFCTNCGTPIVENGKFCSSCGASTNNIAKPQPKSAPIPTTSLYLDNVGENKEELIQALHTATELTLAESHKIVENAPGLILYGVQMPKAEEIKRTLEEHGAKVLFMDNADALSARYKEKETVQEPEQTVNETVTKQQVKNVAEIRDEKALEIQEAKTKIQVENEPKPLPKPLPEEYTKASKKIKTSFIILSAVALALSALFNIAFYDAEYGFSFAVIMTILIAGILFIPFAVIAVIARRKEIKEIRKYKKEQK